VTNFLRNLSYSSNYEFVSLCTIRKWQKLKPIKSHGHAFANNMTFCFTVLYFTELWLFFHIYEQKYLHTHTFTIIEITYSWISAASYVVAWPSGEAMVSVNVVTLHQAQLFLGWEMSAYILTISLCTCNQPTKSTQPGHPYMNRCIDHQQRLSS